MNKSQLISAIATTSGLSVIKAEKALGVALDSIVNVLTKGGSISLVGFGSFGIKKRAARTVRNPRTGKEMTISAKSVPFFKAGKHLKDMIASE